MAVSAGFTVAEIREFVHAYECVPHGGKRVWLAERGVSYDRLRRWRVAVFDGDLERGLIPREGSGMTTPPSKRAALARARAAERDAQAAEITRLNARVHELEESNDALGKAIGLLHAMREEEPAADPMTTDPSASSRPRGTSSPS